MSSRKSAGRKPQTRRGGQAARPVLLPAVAAFVVVAVVTAAVLVARSGDRDAATQDGHGNAGMAHVHGLGVDPADGALIAGTHYGAFRVGKDGDVEQVGPTQDFMGFTVVGARHYLASGHPGAGQDGPGNLGLIESTDGGVTWASVSLAGEADFHVLEARHGRVYGHSGGRLMVSQDKRTWTERATIALADFAVSPDDPDTILATTAQGLVVSTDGGSTFDRVPDAPVMVLITWTDAGTLLGVDPRGVVHVSDDAARNWTERGIAGGPPAALTATGDALFVATRDGRIVESTDGGTTFTTRYSEE